MYSSETYVQRISPTTMTALMVSERNSFLPPPARGQFAHLGPLDGRVDAVTGAVPVLVRVVQRVPDHHHADGRPEHQKDGEYLVEDVCRGPDVPAWATETT